MAAMRARVALSLAFAALVLGASVDARADGDAEGAKKHFEAGRKLRAEGDCAKAIPEFEASLSADRSIGAYYNLGYCQEQLGRRQDAYDAYRRARDLASTKKDDRLKEISGALAALMETPHIRLVLPQPLPNAFTLQVDGETVAASLFQDETVIFTKAGASHTVRASAPGFEDTVVTVETRQLKAIDLRETGKTLFAPPPPPPKELKPAPLHRRPIFGGAVALTGIAAITAGIIVVVKQQQVIDKYDTEAKNLLKVCGPNDTPLSESACRASSNPGFRRDRYIDAASTHNDRLKQGQDLGLFLVAPLAVLGAVAIGYGVYVFVTADSAVAEANAAKLKPPTFTPVVGPTYGGAAMSLRF